MDGKELYLTVKMCLVKSGNMSQAQAADLIGAEKTNFGRKLKAGTLRATEVITLLHALGYKITAERKSDGDKIEL